MAEQADGELEKEKRKPAAPRTVKQVTMQQREVYDTMGVALTRPRQEALRVTAGLKREEKLVISDLLVSAALDSSPIPLAPSPLVCARCNPHPPCAPTLRSSRSSGCGRSRLGCGGMCRRHTAICTAT